jgi:DNA invertase Pin-like site-specific DNA recombinase
MKTSILICRIYSDEQKKGNRLTAQINDGVNYANRNNITIIPKPSKFAFAKSAKGENPFFEQNKERIKFKKAIKFAVDNNANCILFENTDRALRNFNDLHTLQSLIYNHDIEIHFWQSNTK